MTHIYIWPLKTPYHSGQTMANHSTRETLNRRTKRGGAKVASSAGIIRHSCSRKQYWVWLVRKWFRPLPVSPYSPKILIKTSASVPAPITSPVYTLISYLFPGNKDRENLASLGSREDKIIDTYIATEPSVLLANVQTIVTSHHFCHYCYCPLWDKKEDTQHWLQKVKTRASEGGVTHAGRSAVNHASLAFGLKVLLNTHSGFPCPMWCQSASLESARLGVF